jgi:hypothetical protein
MDCDFDSVLSVGRESVNDGINEHVSFSETAMSPKFIEDAEFLSSKVVH